MTTGTAVATEDAARFAPARLPWHPVIEERFGSIGANKASWKALTEAVFPSAKSIDSVVMALSYCAARKLDPFKRPVHIVPMWDSQSRQMVETVWPGISEIRTTAFRTGQYAGCDEVEFGPMVERTFTGMVGKRGYEKEASIKVTYPEWGRINVYRILNGQRCKFVSPKVYWLESYGRQGATDVPNDMWAKRPSGQLEKCVEAAGLRKAFPEEVGNDYSAEEMHGQVLIGDSQASQAQIDPPPPPAEERPAIQPPAPVNTNAGPAAPPAEEVEEAEIVEAPSPAQERAAEAEHPPLAQEEAFDPGAWLDDVKDRFDQARTAQDVDAVHEVFGDDANELLGLTERQRYQDIHEAAVIRTAAQDQAEKTAAAGEPEPAQEADDEDDTIDDGSFPGNDAIAATAPQKTAGDLYLQRIRNVLADPIRTFPSIAGLWNATKAERAELIEKGEITKAQSKELQAEIKKRGEQAQANGSPPAGPGPSAPPAEEDEITAYDRAFRARVEACTTTEEVGALSAGTLQERAKFSGSPLQKEWTGLIANRRKAIAGIV